MQKSGKRKPPTVHHRSLFMTKLALLLSLLLVIAPLTGCGASDSAAVENQSHSGQETDTSGTDGSSIVMIPQYVSETDTDHDGIDDQTDILESAKAYIATNPIYESRYYAGGYPDDGYGVCTDVVAQALLGAGFDLHQLLAEDVKNNSEDYGIDQSDSNIDFRRVPNQNVYFRNHAISLTKDLSKIEEWQGGDIVVFQKHIGIVSDQRNKDGVPYFIHHYSKHQKSYEQDALLKWGDVKGHYRISQ